MLGLKGVEGMFVITDRLWAAPRFLMLSPVMTCLALLRLVELGVPARRAGPLRFYRASIKVTAAVVSVGASPTKVAPVPVPGSIVTSSVLSFAGLSAQYVLSVFEKNNVAVGTGVISPECRVHNGTSRLAAAPRPGPADEHDANDPPPVLTGTVGVG